MAQKAQQRAACVPISVLDELKWRKQALQLLSNKPTVEFLYPHTDV